jgi:hypothetical protein
MTTAMQEKTNKKQKENKIIGWKWIRYNNADK